MEMSWSNLLGLELIHLVGLAAISASAGVATLWKREGMHARELQNVKEEAKREIANVREETRREIDLLKEELKVLRSDTQGEIGKLSDKFDCFENKVIEQNTRIETKLDILCKQRERE